MNGPAFDDRYDPRFQRGYVEGGPDASGGSGSAGGSSGVPGPDASAEPRPTGGARAASAMPAARAEPMRSGAGRPDSTPGPSRTPADADGGAAAVAATAGPVHPEDASIAPEPAGESPAVRRLFALAFGVCGLAIVLGVAWLWSAYTDDGYFMGGAGRTAWDELRWTAASAMLEFGTGAAAVVAIWLGMRQAIRPGRERLLRLPAVIGLGIAIVAALLVLVWIGSSPPQSMLWTGDPAQWTDEQRTEIALGQLRSTLGGPVVRAGLIAALGIVLIAARAAMADGGRGPRNSGGSGSEAP